MTAVNASLYNYYDYNKRECIRVMNVAKLEIQTDQDLLKKLEELAKRGLTKEEAEKQRISFIYSGMPNNSGMSKIQIEKSLKRA